MSFTVLLNTNNLNTDLSGKYPGKSMNPLILPAMG